MVTVALCSSIAATVRIITTCMSMIVEDLFKVRKKAENMNLVPI
jgi:hypothetical protein